MELSPSAEDSLRQQKNKPAMFEELAELEKQFDDVDVEILRKQYGLQGPIYAKRNALIARIPYFWRLVFEQAPPEIDTYVQPSDSEVLNACLTNITVERFEIAPAPAAGAALQANGAGNGSGDGIAEKARGDPRSLLIRFEFAANEYFFDDVLEKRFWYRRGKDGWTGLVSEPVRVAWKEGKDLMEGLGDLACDAWEEERNLRAEGKGDEAVRSAPVWKELLERVEASTPGSLSFFAWWGYRGRLVSAEESEQAVKAEREKRKGITVGEECTRAGNAGGDKEYGEEDDEDIEEEENEDVYAHEIFPLGDELAISIAEDLYPGAIKYFVQAQEQEVSEVDSEDDSDDDDDNDADESGSVPNLRHLVDPRGNHNDDINAKGRRGVEDDDDGGDEEERRPRKRTRN